MGKFKKLGKRCLAAALVFTVACTTVFPGAATAKAAVNEEEPYIVSMNRPSYASSQNGGDTASKAFDGDENTRWQAAQDDKDEWIYVDLGKVTQITGVHVSWEAAAASKYTVQFSDDEATWEDVLKVEDGKGPQERDLDVAGNARYVRIQCRERVMNYGCSLYEFQVYGLNGLAPRPVDYGVNLAINKPVAASSIQTEWWMRKAANDRRVRVVNEADFENEVNKLLEGGEPVNENGEPLKKDQMKWSDGYICDLNGKPVFNQAIFKAQVKDIIENRYPVDENGNHLTDGTNWFVNGDGYICYAEGKTVLDQMDQCPQNAVDGVIDGKVWHPSTANANKRVDDQWMYVDLEKSSKIGRIILDWSAPARAYQLQVSSDAKNWETIYSKMNDYATRRNIPIYAEGRYVRIYCLAGWSFNDSVGLKEIQIFEYREGDEKKTYEPEEIPTIQTVPVSGSEATYATDDVRFPMAKPPAYLAEELQMPNKPVASNDWWQTITITALGNGLVALPLRTKYSASGLGVTGVNDCWYADESREGALGSAVINSKTDFYLTPEGMDVTEIYDKVVDYSDYSVSAQLCDANGPVMTNTIVKGSPYLFAEFGDRQDVVIYSNNITGIFDDNGQELLKEENAEITIDHFGFEITDDDNKTKTKTAKSYFSVNLPAQTKVRRIGGKIRIRFSETDGYLSIGEMTKRADLKTFYQHGYAFVRDTSVTYEFDENTSKVTTYYNVTTDLKREGFSADTMQCLFPHQYKKSDASVSDELTYVSSRGTMKTLISNRFETVDTFYGMVPQFTTPQNEEYSGELVQKYLSQIEEQTRNEKANGDAYWEGKAFHPLALATLVADQTGNMEYRGLFLERLRYLFEDWFTYSGEDDDAYFYYDKNWGTLYYRFSEFGANWGICDHHFTYGYFLFAAAVLATYDDAFYEEYKEMLDLIVRDFASPYEDDELFCRFRSYDLYEGHSWAGGYADNDNGNNQEAGGESLFGWVGMYLWAIRSQNKDFRDAAIFGFTTELNDVEQYWFNYDGDNWPKDYPHYIVGQNYGATIFMGTFFDGNMTSVYGIHWLPVAEWITHYAMGDNKEKLQKMYEGLLKEIEGQQQIEVENGNSADIVKTTLTAWQHIFVPLRSQYDPDKALEDYWKVVNGEVTNADGAVVKFDNNEQFNAYWFANSMKDLGSKTDEIYALDGVAASVYKNGKGEYQALVWNPTQEDMKVRFTDGSTIVGSATVGASSLVRFNPLEKELIQVSTPEFSLTSDTYDDTQYVEISTATQGAAIHYTTDGSNPTANSPVYSGPIAVSSTTTLKAIGVKDGYIDSKMESVNIRINGSPITTGKNIALGKTVTASSGEASAANIVDGSAKTRWETAKTGDTYNADDWCTIDLGQEYTINKVKISWEAAYATKYKIQVSSDNATWENVYTENAGNGGFDELIFESTPARYVRMQGVERGSAYGYSIYEMGVYEARQITKPEFSIASGEYGKGQKLTIASGTKAVEIRYTLDGTQPTAQSPLYVGPLTLGESVSVKAKAFKLGMLSSETAEASYTITDNGNIVDESKWRPTPDPDIEEELLDGESGETTDDPLLKTCLSYQKAVTVSSSENEGSAKNVTDGSMDTGWSSAFAENGTNFADEKRFNQWCYIDLGESVEFNEVKIKWITSNNEYKIQVSDDAQNWTDVFVRTQPTAGDKTDICRFDNVKARYVKMQGVKVGQAWGYSLAEMMVYRSEAEQPLGENVAQNANITDVSADASRTVTLDLFKKYRIDKVVLNGAQEFTGNITIRVSATGRDGEWVDVKKDAEASSDGIYKFEEQEARYVQVEFSGALDTLSLGEIEVYTVGSPDKAEVQVTYYDRQGAGASSNAQNADKMIDGIATNASMWQADKTDTNAWCYIYLGTAKEVNIVSVHWEASYAADYDIYLTDSVENWTPDEAELAYAGEHGKAGEVETILTNPKTARYVVIRQTKTSENSGNYGCAVYEMNAGYRAPILVERVMASPSNAAIAVGQTLTAVCTVSPSNADNTNVTWSSDNEAVATVSDKGVIKGKGAGTAVITVASQADETVKATISVSVSGPLSMARPTANRTGENEITVNWEANGHAIGYNIYRAKSQTGKYTKINGDMLAKETVEYIDSQLAKGTYYYKVEAVAAEGDAVYQTSMSTQSIGVQITSVVNSISLDMTGANMKKDEELTLSVTSYPADLLTELNVQWSIDKPEIADLTPSGTHNEKCTVKAKAAGEATVTVTAGSLSSKCKIKVTEQPAKQLETPVLEGTAEEYAVTLRWEAVENALSYDVYRAAQRGGTYNKLANVTEAVYTDTVEAAGTYYYKVAAKGNGEWADSADSNIVEIVVEQTGELPEAESVTFDKTTASLKVGEELTLTATVKPDGADKRLSWESSKPDVADVSNGKITALAEGKTTITATASSGVFASCEVTVEKKDEEGPNPPEKVTISLSASEGRVLVGKTVKVDAVVTPEGTPVAWKSDDEEIATVKDGVITGIKAGETVITATAGKESATYTVTVVDPEEGYVEVESVTLDKTTAELKEGDTLTLTAKIMPENATYKKVDWSSSDPAVAVVKDGVVTAVAKGKTTIKATALSGAFGSCEITVTALQGGDDNQNPGGNGGGDQNGGQNPGGNGTGGSNEKVTVSSVKLVVASRPYGIKTVYLKKKAKAALAATVVTTGTNKNVTYTSDNPAVASVNGKGQVKAGSKTGTATITAQSVADPTKKASIKVKVVAKTAKNKILKLRKTRLTLNEKGEQVQIQIKKYTKKTTNTVSYKVISGKKYVKVDKYGVVTSKVNSGKKALKAKIRVTCGKKKAVLTVTISKKKS